MITARLPCLLLFAERFLHGVVIVHKKSRLVVLLDPRRPERVLSLIDADLEKAKSCRWRLRARLLTCTC